MLRVGLTGGIGSGKSTVAGLFAARGVTVIDADDIVHKLITPGSASHQEILAHFGNAVLSTDGSGRLDRALLRARVFADPAERRRLEAILHPRVREEMLRQALRASGPYVLLVIPLLFESGQRDLVDRVLVVDADAQTQIRRVQARGGLGEEEVGKILAAQIAPTERRALADDVIENNADLAHLEHEVARLHALYLTLAQKD
jgi:dephospho-CoA kinase